MKLAASLVQQLKDQKLTLDERAVLSCHVAGELEERGEFEAACSALGEIWQGIGSRPLVGGLDELTVAELLLRSGTLSGHIGSAKQTAGAQEAAKDLISESIDLFERLGETEKATAARGDLALCYWREGAFNEARVLLEDVLLRFSESAIALKAKAILQSVLVEFSTSRFNDALRILTEAAPIFEATEDHVLKGRFHGQRALTLKCLGIAEQRPDYLDRAVIELTASSYHFEKAGHTFYCACGENNLGNLLLLIGRYDEAQLHLNRARLSFASLKDSGMTAQVDETRARLLLAQGRMTGADRAIRESVRVLERGGEQSVLAESLTTQGVVLARLGRYDQSCAVLQRAMNIAQQVGALERAGRAALTLLEEHAERMDDDQRREVYARADDWLSGTQDTDDIARLRACARRVTASAAGGVLTAETATINEPRAGLSLPEAVGLYEEQMIERALREARGRITHAARLLGLKHQTLASIIRSRHKRLLQLRTPVQHRRRSIIKRR